MGKFERDGEGLLKRAYAEGGRRSRFEDKKEGVDSRFIYAEVSHKNHFFFALFSSLVLYH